MNREKGDQTARIGLTLEGEMLKRFSTVKKKWGIQSNADVIRMLITNAYEKIPAQRPTLEHFNLDETGVSVVDRDLNRIIKIYFKPEKVLCEYDGMDDCKHVRFALELPEVQKILKEKGWKVS